MNYFFYIKSSLHYTVIHIIINILRKTAYNAHSMNYAPFLKSLPYESLKNCFFSYTHINTIGW